MDVFSWSMPFLAEKVVTMLHNIVKNKDVGDDVDVETLIKKGIDQQSAEEKAASKSAKIKAIKGKVQTVGRLSKMICTLREESEDLLKLKNMSPDGRLPRGLLLSGKPAIKNAMK